MLNADYGDISDVENGTDLTITANKNPGQSFPITKVTPQRKSSKILANATDSAVKDLLDSIPDFSSLHQRKTSQEVGVILDEFLSKGDESPAPEGGRETAKYGGKSSAKSVAKKKDPIDAAFEELDAQ